MTPQYSLKFGQNLFAKEKYIIRILLEIISTAAVNTAFSSYFFCFCYKISGKYKCIGIRIIFFDKMTEVKSFLRLSRLYQDSRKTV